LVEKNHFFANPWLRLGAIVLPIVLSTAIIYSLLHSIVFGFMGVVLSIILFFYCLGPDNAFYPLSDSKLKNDSNIRMGNYFASVNRQLFAVIFWYIIAGPIAVLTYRLITLCTSINEVKLQATQATDVLEWVPARMTALLYLLVGNFQQGFSLFIQYILAKPAENDSLLSQCGLQAVKSNTEEEVPMPVAENLVEQALIVLLVFIAIFTLVAWM